MKYEYYNIYIKNISLTNPAVCAAVLLVRYSLKSTHRDDMTGLVRTRTPIIYIRT